MRNCVDDLALGVAHTEVCAAIEFACDVAATVAEGFKDKGLKVSPKTLVVPSTSKTFMKVMAKIRT